MSQKMAEVYGSEMYLCFCRHFSIPLCR